MSAEILAFPVQPRSCVDCVNFRASEHEERCALYEVQIMHEEVAASDCEGYECS